MLESGVVKRKIWLWVTLGLVAFVVVVVIATVAMVPLTSDTLRHRMIETLSARLDADVAIGDLHWRVFPTVRASGSALTLRRHGHNDPQPLISIKSFTVDARLAGLLRKRVAHVTLDGLVIAIPPGDDADSDTAKTS
jgi:uncharacterized protein involved in outer membrane biogenesis